jgi:hypothetical protein
VWTASPVVARRLAGDAATAQGAEATVEQDGDLGAHDGEKVFCFTRLSRGRDKGNRVRHARGAAGGKWSTTGWKPRAAEWSGHARGVEEEYLSWVDLGLVTSSSGWAQLTIQRFFNLLVPFQLPS